MAYEYLWLSRSQDRDDGAKVYPVIIVHAVDRDGLVLAYALGISHALPKSGDRAVEVPRKLKRHLGLDEEPAWAYTDQFNVFVWPGPDLRPAEFLTSRPHARGTCVIGALPQRWFQDIAAHFHESFTLGRAKALKR